MENAQLGMLNWEHSWGTVRLRLVVWKYVLGVFFFKVAG